MKSKVLLILNNIFAVLNFEGIKIVWQNLSNFNFQNCAFDEILGKIENDGSDCEVDHQLYRE